ncbi:hypothetical protein HPP92_000619 [Vanilla planifolia]|uniref:Uncharacterized protein n=1 Tax=Vanilla planifolia TaxID=51239 RepID=A0A835RSG4_VANPL|nr:hypothetical protein HPP92_000619 [Vanilla planifolia]
MERCAPKTTEKERGGEGLEVGRGEGEGVLKEVRIVLTNEEIEWFMEQMGEKQRGSKLHELVAELAERGRREGGEREKGNRWQPVLESIMEVPESQSFGSPPPTPPVPPPPPPATRNLAFSLIKLRLRPMA